MNVANTDELLYGRAYYKKKYVNIPLAHLPEELIDNNGDIRFYRVIYIDQPPEPEDPLPVRKAKALQQYFASEEETIDPCILSDKDLKKICKDNNIPISWVTDRFLRKQSVRKKDVNRREDRKNMALTSEEFKKVLHAIKSLSKQSALIISIQWYLNSVIGGGGGYVTLEDVLRIQVVNFMPGTEKGPAQIRLERIQKNGIPLLISVSLLSRLEKAISREIQENAVFIFSNKYGGPQFLDKVNKDLKEAATQAGIGREVSSLALRPVFNKKKVRQSVKRLQVNTTPIYDPMNIDEWQLLCKEVPEIFDRKGKRSDYHPRDILNGIFYHIKKSCPFRSIPDSFPPWRAISSQLRRWKKNGIFEAILTFRKRSVSS